MAKRTGVPSLLEIATKMCVFIGKYGSVIVALYPSNVALAAALEAANAACGVLAGELAKVRELGD